MKRSAPALLLLALAVGALADEKPAPPAYRVVVNRENPETVLDRKFVADVFLKKTTRWSDGTLVRPADLSASAAARQHFSDNVLGRSVSAVKSYWEQAIFSGRDTPPPELDSDEAMVRFVAKHAGAIGYVSPNADVTTVKTVSVR
jgi:ABC-type phosphate transport system substrate-binding protein